MQRSITHALKSILFTILAALLLLVPQQQTLAQETAVAPAQAAPETPIAARLETLLKNLEAARVEHHVPGVGIAVVKDGEIILSTGLGFANIENQTPVTGDTVFAIGSCTKAFTATLVGILVDEGKMDFDDLVTKHIPEFQMRDEKANAEITIRDLLSHRSGLARMDLLWAAGTLSRAEILAACAVAEPMHGFREKFEYSNTNFIAAGEAAARAGGADWTELVRAKIFKPLQMNNSSLSVAEAKTKPNLATGYMWDDIHDSFDIDPMRAIDSAAPAGSINSSASEMANWLLMQLARGEFKGKRVISEAQLEQIWAPHTPMAPSISYALGWMNYSWKGRQVIEHGGNIDGFSAQVGFLPDENIGFVLLLNTSFSAMQALGDSIIFGALLDDTNTAVDPAAAEQDYEPYLGKYIANFGPFHDKRFTVQMKNDRLAIDVPGQMVFELNEPNDEGKWIFQITDTIAVSFDRDDHDKVVGLKMYQSGMTFELPREGHVSSGDMTMETAREYLGMYHFEQINADAEVLLRNGRLAIDVPSEMVYELHPPDDDGRWVFRAKDNIFLVFNRSEAGAIESVALNNAGQIFTLPRTGDPDPAETVTLDDVMALHLKAVGSDQLANIKTVRLVGVINFVNQGLTGEIEVLARGMSHYRNHIDLGRSGVIDVIVAGDQGWSASSFDQTETLEGKYLRSAQRQHPLLLVSDWRTFADKVELRETKQIDGRAHYMVRVKLDEIIDSVIAIDAETGLVTQEDITVAARGIGSLPMKLKYDDYGTVAGVNLPFRMTLETGFHGTVVMQFTSIEMNVELPTDAFAAPADTDAAP